MLYGLNNSLCFYIYICNYYEREIEGEGEREKEIVREKEVLII